MLDNFCGPCATSSSHQHVCWFCQQAEDSDSGIDLKRLCAAIANFQEVHEREHKQLEMTSEAMNEQVLYQQYLKMLTC